jgi:hypothetical protein
MSLNPFTILVFLHNYNVKAPKPPNKLASPTVKPDFPYFIKNGIRKVVTIIKGLEIYFFSYSGVP